MIQKVNLFWAKVTCIEAKPKSDAGAGKVLQLCPTPEAAVSYEASASRFRISTRVWGFGGLGFKVYRV